MHLKRYLKSVATFGMKIYNLKYNFQSTANQLKNNCHEIIIISHKCRLLPEINLDFNKRNIKSYISVHWSYNRPQLKSLNAWDPFKNIPRRAIKIFTFTIFSKLSLQTLRGLQGVQVFFAELASSMFTLPLNGLPKLWIIPFTKFKSLSKVSRRIIKLHIIL